MQPTTREDLQSSLDRARQILTDLDRSRRQTADLKTKIITHVPALLPMPKKPEWTGWKGALKIAASVVVAFLITSFFVPPLAVDAAREGMYDGNTALVIFSAIAMLLLTFGVPVATPFVLRGIRKQQNEKIEAINVEREANLARDLEAAACNNQHVVNQLNDLAQFMEVLRMAWQAEVAPWYPPDYEHPKAAEFFLKAVRNYQADSIKEMVNLYEEHLHRNRMEAETLRQTMLTAELSQTIDARLAENNQLLRQQVLLSGVQAVAGAVSAGANVATAANSGTIANHAGTIAHNTGAIARNTGDIADRVAPGRNSPF